MSANHTRSEEPLPADADSTLDLLTAARAGDTLAFDRLFHRYVPGLRQWATGRLPGWARDLAETQDLVQETVFRVFRNLDGFDYRGEGALKAYLRQSLMNRIRNEIRRAGAKPGGAALASDMPDWGASPADMAVAAETRERYEVALQNLSDADREVVIARVELGLTYEEIATMLKRTSADAVRMAVGRALVRVSRDMGRA